MEASNWDVDNQLKTMKTDITGITKSNESISFSVITFNFFPVLVD